MQNLLKVEQSQEHRKLHANGMKQIVIASIPNACE